MKKLTIIIAAMAMLAIIASAGVQAESYLSYQGLGLGAVNGVYYQDSREGSGVFGVSNVWVGTIKVKLSNDDKATWGSMQQMLCVDLAGRVPQSAPDNPWAVTLMTGYKPAGVVSNMAWDKVTKLVDSYLPSVISASSNADAARLQALVWEIMRDDPTNLSAITGGSTSQTDAFRLAGTPSWATDATAQQMFNVAEGAEQGYGSGHQWYLANNDNFQDLVFYMPVPSNAVPEVPTAVLAPLGLTLIGLIRRKFSV